MPAWSMSWLRPICPGHSDRDYDERIIFELKISQGGGQESRRNVPRTFLRTKSINESSVKKQCTPPKPSGFMKDCFDDFVLGRLS